MVWTIFSDSYVLFNPGLDLWLGYVGPAPVYTAIGAIIALVLSIVGALLAVILWPLRRWLKRRKAAAAQLSDEAAQKSKTAGEDGDDS